MKPGIPQGTRDFAPKTVRERQFILNSIKEVYELYGYQPLETPAMENLTTLTGKYGEEGDKLMFKILNNGLSNPDKKDTIVSGFQQIMDGKNDLKITERALRYDLTIPFARFVAMHHNDLALPFKRYQMQPVWRADRPQKGRYREFWQCDADVVGSVSLINEAELLAIYRTVFHRLQIPGIAIRINSRKILAGLAEYCGASDKLTDMTIAIDKLDKIGWEGVAGELTTRGFNAGQIATIAAYIDIRSDNTTDMLEALDQLIGSAATAREGIREIKTTLEYHELLEQHEWNNKIVVDFTLARGLNYYTGIIVEVTTDAVSMGSIGGGGRYDDLTGLFGLKGISGVGISFGIDRIYDVMEQLGLFPDSTRQSVNVLFLNIDSNTTTHVLTLVNTLRKSGISCEMYMDVSKMDKQMKYANKRGLKYIAFVGSQEMEQGKIALKNMETGSQELLDLHALAATIQ